MFGWLRRQRSSSATMRWVVLDVETSGTDIARDRLISIGAVALHADRRVCPADSFEVVYRQPVASSHDNILIHGIGIEAQGQGIDPELATARFIDYIGDSPLIAFHAPFDRGFIDRTVKVHIDRPFDNPWLDLAQLAPVLEPKAGLKSLDEWLKRYAIPVSARHSAAADAFATALLALRLLPRAHAMGAASFNELQVLARQARWLPA